MRTIKFPPHLAYLRSTSDFSLLPESDLKLLLKLFNTSPQEYKTVEISEEDFDNIEQLIAALKEQKSSHQGYTNRVRLTSEEGYSSRVEIHFSRDFLREEIEEHLKVLFRNYENQKKDKAASTKNAKEARKQLFLKLQKEFGSS